MNTDKLKSLLSQCTPGKWTAYFWVHNGCRNMAKIDVVLMGQYVKLAEIDTTGRFTPGQGEANMELMAMARELAEDVISLRSQLQKIKEDSRPKAPGNYWD